tara:strand:+ start:382 stop:768 length:387 start_codon:yes stop_codon:yes gene_type:complete
MNNLNINLSEVLDVEPITIENEVVVIENVIDDDAEYARVNIRALITKGNLAMDNLLHVAKESEHPRAYEVAANMLKNLADMNKDLMEIQKRKKDLLPHETKSNSMNIDKAVFVGSTTELVKFLKNNKA